MLIITLLQVQKLKQLMVYAKKFKISQQDIIGTQKQNNLLNIISLKVKKEILQIYKDLIKKKLIKR